MRGDDPPAGCGKRIAMPGARGFFPQPAIRSTNQRCILTKQASACNSFPKTDNVAPSLHPWEKRRPISPARHGGVATSFVCHGVSMSTWNDNLTLLASYADVEGRSTRGVYSCGGQTLCLSAPLDASSARRLRQIREAWPHTDDDGRTSMVWSHHLVCEGGERAFDQGLIQPAEDEDDA